MIDPPHAPAPFPHQTQGRINRLFAEGKLTPAEAADATMELRDSGSGFGWRLVQGVAYVAALVFLAWLLLGSRR